MDHKEVSRLLFAAVVSKGFEKLLLSDPKRAIETGYNGKAFMLTEQDKETILSIQANNLTDFAKQLNLHNGYQEEAPVGTTKKVMYHSAI